MNRSRRVDLTVEISTRHTAEIRGTRVADALRYAGITQRQFLYQPPSGNAPCWAIPATAVGELEAAAETKHWPLRILEPTLWDGVL